MKNEIFEPYTSLEYDIFCPSGWGSFITMTKIIVILVTRWCTLIHLMEATNGMKERYIYIYIYIYVGNITQSNNGRIKIRQKDK